MLLIIIITDWKSVKKGFNDGWNSVQNTNKNITGHNRVARPTNLAGGGSHSNGPRITKCMRDVGSRFKVKVLFF